MAADAVEVKLERKDSLSSGDSNPKPDSIEMGLPPPTGAAHQVKDQRIGEAETLTMGEFRDAILQKDGGNGGAEAERQKHKTGFGGSWKCAVALAVGLTVAIIFTIVVAVTSSKQKVESAERGAFGQRNESVFKEAAVATDVDVCSDMGRDILLEGGSAVDAAITAQLCVGLVNSQSSGLGGGFFMVIYNAGSGTGEFLDARETAPSAADESYVAHLKSSTPYGINLTAVPGEVRGLWDAHRKYGVLHWEDLFRPVIKLAKEGYRVTEHLNITLQNMKQLSQYPGEWDIYMREDGTHKRTGDKVYNSALADTLKALAENGADEFYTGATARKIIEEIESLGGVITMEDLAGYETRWGEVLTTDFADGLTLLAPSMPSGGPVLQFLINVMDAFNLSRTDFDSESGLIKTYHRFIEASKFAFGLRSHLGEGNTTDIQQARNTLSSLAYARTVADSIPDDGVTYTNVSSYHVTPNVNPTLGGTSHVSVLAANGDAVSLTSSVNYRFGSRVRSGATGIIYNNQMADFSFLSSSPNFVRPGKRPLSSMCGSVVVGKDGRVKLVEGSAGSKRIITINAWIILSTLLGDVPLAKSINDRRLHCEVKPDAVHVDYEDGFPKGILDGLRKLGHDPVEKGYLSIVQAILRQSDGDLLAYSDSRKPPGKPAGY